MLSHGNQILPYHVSKLMRPFILDGVTIFFVLSGFLIGRILIRDLETKGNKMSSLVSFWKRRWYRTLPNYFVVLILLTALHFLFSPNFTFKDAALHFLFMQNLCWAPPWFFPEAWSISVEEWFYLSVPFLLFMLTRIPGLTVKHASLASILFILVASSILRVEHFYHLEAYDHTASSQISKTVIMRLDSIMYGMLGAYISFYYAEHWFRNRKRYLAIGSALTCLAQYLYLNFAGLYLIYHNVFSFSLFSLAFLLLLPFLSTYHNSKTRIYNLISKLSLISYSLYLLHLTFIKGIVLVGLDIILPDQLGAIRIVYEYILFWCLSLIASILLYKYWELPMMNLRDRQFKSSRS